VCEPEVTLLQEIGYAVFDGCVVFTVVSGAPSAQTEERRFFQVNEGGKLPNQSTEFIIGKFATLAEAPVGGEHHLPV